METKVVILTLDNIDDICRATGEKPGWLRQQYWEAKREGKVVQVQYQVKYG